MFSKIMSKAPLLILIVALLTACSKQNSNEKNKIMTIEPSSLSTNLYYTGSIQPLTTLVIPAPVDGVVIDKPFEYGSEVKSKQRLFMISSTKFLADYKAALLAYVKAKSEFNNNKTVLTQAKFLHTNELISDDDFKMKQSNYYAAQLAFLQSKDALQSLIAQLEGKKVNLFNLEIAEVERITKAMQLNKSAETIPIYAPADGLVLSPTKAEDEAKKLNKGDVVKQGDVLAIIGDVKGISIKIKVNELTVNQLKIGQAVKVTGIAFPDDLLMGEIRRIDHQGETSGNGLPTFAVEVAVTKLTPKQRQDIHVGMSAKVEILVADDAKIMIPITALKEINGDTYVDKYDEKQKKALSVAVRTGKTSLDSVAIISGLQAGDKIVIPN